MLANLSEKFKHHRNNILLVIIVFLLVLLAFGAGMVVQFYLAKPPLIIENPIGK